MRTVVLRGLSMTVVLVALLIAASNGMAQDVPPEELSSGQVPVSEKRKTEVYGAFSILGTIPNDKNLNAGVFPTFARGVFDVEGEVFGLGGKLGAPQPKAI